SDDFDLPQQTPNLSAPPAAINPAAQIYASQINLPVDLPAELEAVERAIIERALESTKFNRTAAAKLLGITFRQLRYRMQQLDIR
ncbi:MAG TPA: helix-turn-helix domain-containing protein, partial [Burkholderiaceae bacterium]|nr:helix-turn-helix domain-containing protein [Burkholderiaceae bacterium]